MSSSQTLRRIALLLTAIAVSLVIAAALHLSGQVHGRAAMFQADDAGIAEAVIGIVLASGAFALWRSGPGGRRAALAATGFAIAGFCVGLTITAQAGRWPDIAYHVAILPLLVLSFVTLLRGGHVPSGT